MLLLETRKLTFYYISPSFIKNIIKLGDFLFPAI